MIIIPGKSRTMKKMKVFALISLLGIGFLNTRGQHVQCGTLPYPTIVGPYQVNQYADNYYVITEPLPDPHISLIMVTEPRRSLVQIFRKGRLIVQGTAPLSIKVAKPGHYKIIIRLPNGLVWTHTIFVQPGFRYMIGVTGYSTPHPEPVSNVEFTRMLHQLKKTPFSSTKLRLLKSMVAGHYFTIHQAKLLVQTFEFDSDRLKACKILFHSLVHPEDAYMLASVFTFSSTKHEWFKWLRRQGY